MVSSTPCSSCSSWLPGSASSDPNTGTRSWSSATRRRCSTGSARGHLSRWTSGSTGMNARPAPCLLRVRTSGDRSPRLQRVPAAHRLVLGKGLEPARHRRHGDEGRRGEDEGEQDGEHHDLCRLRVGGREADGGEAPSERVGVGEKQEGPAEEEPTLVPMRKPTA